MSKIGLLGGTFDPPHIGHFIMAQEVKTTLNLDEIWFIPTNQPPHKEPAFFSGETRLNMLRRATEATSGFSVEPMELTRQGKSYTIDTIKSLKEEYPQHEFYFIIGGDMVEYMPKWNKIEELITLVEFVGVKRRGYTSKTEFPVTMVDTPIIDISSTDIKAWMKQGHDVKYFLPNEVYRYMKEYFKDERNGSK